MSIVPLLWLLAFGPPAQMTSRARTPPAAPPRATEHVLFQTFVTQDTVAPGTRFSVGLKISPKPAMHVYAPPQAQYRAVTLTIEKDRALIVHPIVFPPAEDYYFEPLDERVKVYTRPFRVTQDVTIATTPEIRRRAQATDARLTIKGTLAYQACDDTMCFLPTSVPVSWTVHLKAR